MKSTVATKEQAVDGRGHHDMMCLMYFCYAVFGFYGVLIIFSQSNCNALAMAAVLVTQLPGIISIITFYGYDG